MSKTIIIFIIAVIAVGGGAFYGGLQYGKSQAANAQNLARQGRQGSGGQGGQFGRAGRNGAGFVGGAIIAKDDKSITVQNQQNGGSKIIFLSGNTQISKFAAGSPADLAVGQNVAVNGAANSDGSITAQMIQLRPARPKNATSVPEK